MVSKEKFLSNQNTKQQFLFLLENHLKEIGIQVLSSPGDADVLMCRQAVEYSYTSNVALIGDDTYLLIILLHMTKTHAFEDKLYLTTKTTVHDVEQIRNKLSHGMVDSILLIHAVEYLVWAKINP